MLIVLLCLNIGIVSEKNIILLIFLIMNIVSIEETFSPRGEVV